MLRGIVISRGFWSAMIFGLLFVCKGLTKIGITNSFIQAVINPYVAFTLVMIVEAIWLYPFLKPHWMSVFVIAGMAVVAFGVSWVMYM